MKLLKNPQRYMGEELEFVRKDYDHTTKIDYPVVKCGDILLHFNHADSFEEADNTWTRRKQRINWDNLFVMMYTEKPDIANEFAKLPYKKKICFVPFESNEESMIFVEFRNKNEMEKLPFWEIVNGMASGKFPYYDVFYLLEHAKFKKIVEIY